jgi:hypothetical protein
MGDATDAVGAADLNFRLQNMGMEGIGTVGATTDAQGNQTLDIQESEQTGIFRDILDKGAMGSLGESGDLRPGVSGLGAQATGAAGQAFGALGSFDPMTAAQERFDKLDSILQPGRERTRSGLESRMFAQGRMDSTAGSRELADLEAGFQRERAGMLDQQFGQAQGAQANLANIAQGLTGTAGGVQSGIFGQGLQGIGGSQQMSEPMMRLLGMSSDFGQQTFNAKLQKQQAMADAQASDDAAEAAGGFMNGPMGTILGGLATGAATAFGGPLGGMAAKGLMGAMSGGGGGGGGGGGLTSAGANMFSSFGR